MNIILYKKLVLASTDNMSVIHYYSEDGIITEQYPDGKTISWRRHPSDLWSKMPKDWVPGRVVHRLEGKQPLHFELICTGETISASGESKVQPSVRPRVQKTQPYSRKQEHRGLFQQCLIKLP